VFTVVWMAVEAAVSIGAGFLAHSALLTAFGIDSVIELVSGAILLWRLLVEARSGRLERVDGSQYLSIPPGPMAYVTTRQGGVDAVDLGSHAVFSLLTGGTFGPWITMP
jgi:hypothetical protein